MNKALFWFGVIATGLAAVLAIASSDLGANGMPTNAHPVSSVGLALAALAAFYGSDILTRQQGG